MKTIRKTQGFTLIELLVVVSIIALLAVGTVPMYGKIMLDVRAKSSVRNAYQIHVGLVNYATGHDGNFPSQTADGQDIQTANDAYRQLFVQGTIDDEKLFFVPNSKWHGTKTAPDGNIGNAQNNFQNALETGENHYAYQSGLNMESSDSRLPLVFDGGKEGAPGTFSREPNEKGGVWKGKYAVVVRVGGGAKAVELDNTLMVKDKKDGKDMDIFSEEFGSVRNNLRNPM